jgi:hypothetical protein
MKRTVKALLAYISPTAKKQNAFPNVHLSADDASRELLPDLWSCYLRKTHSDAARVGEYRAQIYVPQIDLMDKVRALKPTVLLDVGANIGLSTLSMVKSIPSITTVIGLEAEAENFKLLKMNYELWSNEFSAPTIDPSMESRGVKFIPLWTLASSEGGRDVHAKPIYLPGGKSASGTFAPTAKIPKGQTAADSNRPPSDNVKIATERTQLNQIVEEHAIGSATVVAKIDIEGGEEELMAANTEWLGRTLFLTTEIHDRMGVPNASRPLLKSLLEFDFAIAPEKDVLNCFNRELLGLR